MNDRIMVKMTASEDWIIFKTVTKEKKSTSLYVRRDELLSLADSGRLIAWDSSFAAFAHDNQADTVNIWFHWISISAGGRLTGWRQHVTLPFKPFMDFIEGSVSGEQPQEWRALSIEAWRSPRFIFRSKVNLHAVIADKLIRRKLCKFLRDYFCWKKSEEIIFTDDFVPYSFLFTEIRDDTVGIYGGLILHGQENMEKAHYEIHT